MTESIGKAYKPWLLMSLAMLVGSLILLAVAGTVAFVGAADVAMPLWVIVLAAVAGLGVVLGFGGFFLIMAVAGWASWKEARRVEVISPERAE